MKTKEFVFEVVATKTVKVILPESYLDEEFQKEWEKGLWPLDGDTPEEKFRDIARYAARVAFDDAGYAEDGIGVLQDNRWGNKIDYEESPFAVVGYVLQDYGADESLEEEKDWV